MMVSPSNPQEWQAMAGFLLARAGVQPSHDMVMLGWVAEGHLQIAVALTSFLGSTAQIHIAFAPDWHFSPREMIREIFRYAFVKRDLKMLIGIVNSHNHEAIKFDQRLGFREIHRLKGMHDDGGDIVVFGMEKKDCRYLTEPKLEGEQEGAHFGHA